MRSSALAGLLLIACVAHAAESRPDGDVWRVRSGGLYLDVGFDARKGLVLTQFGNEPTKTVCPDANSVFLPVKPGAATWRNPHASRRKAVVGGREVDELTVTLESDSLGATCRLTAYPDASVVRIAYEFVARVADAEVAWTPLFCRWKDHWPGEPLRALVFRGGEDRYQLGGLEEHRLGPCSEPLWIQSVASYRYAPILILETVAEDGPCFLFGADTMERWEGVVYRYAGAIQTRIGTLRTQRLAPGERAESPVFTIAAAKGGRDGMMRTLYDWQYRYMWDYTNPDYFAKLRTNPNWVMPTRNAHEQFTWRIACYAADADRQRETGAEVVWDDAGWSMCATNYPPDSFYTVKINDFEGCDYRVARRAFHKSGLKQLIWFGRKHDLGVLEGKHGAWGEFEWRTDMFYELETDENEAGRVRRDIVDYLERDGNRSFHTCNCGSTYSQMFDIQRYATYNYLADLKSGPYHNAYISCFAVPDKMADLLLAMSGAKSLASDGSTRQGPRQQGELGYERRFARSRLSLVPITGSTHRPEDVEAVRLDYGIYKYLRSQGVAGKGCYMYHPEQWGCDSFVYRQRVSADHRRSVLIQAATPGKRCLVFPRGLLPDEDYHVSFQNSSDTCVRTGRDLMENGFDFRTFTDGELVYFNLPDHPGSGRCPRPDEVQGLFVRPDDAFGRSGVGVFWSPCAGNPDDFYFEVARDGKVIGCPAFGCYWFDREAGAFPAAAKYAVRAVNYDGVAGPWREVRLEETEGTGVLTPFGDFGRDMAKDGWAAEYSSDGQGFTPMTWVPPAASPLADIGGTPNQPGGIEGYFEGGACGRIGRGWMQADVSGYVALSLTAPRAGRLAASGRAMKEFYHRAVGGDLEVLVLRNGRRIASGTLVSGDLIGFVHNLSLDVAKGDVLRFVVTPGGGKPVAHHDAEARIVGWIPRLAYERKADSASRAKVTTFADFGAVRSVRRSLDVPSGAYTVKMTWRAREQGLFDENRIRVRLNGEPLERDFDIRAFSRGRGGEVVRIYRYRVPAADGRLEIAVDGTDVLPLERIDIAPEFRPIVRLNCGADRAYVDWAGEIWPADALGAGGRAVSFGGDVRQATPTVYDQELYRTALVGGDLVWRIPVPSGIYGVQLKFAEMEDAAAGERTADVFVNGKLVRAGYDAAAVAGSARQAVDVRFEGVVPRDGVVEVRVKARGKRPAAVQALVVE